MKKVLATFLSICMLVTCMSVQSFASVKDETSATETSNTSAAANIDYWILYQPMTLATGNVTVYPGANENLKLHFYMYTTNPLEIEVIPFVGASRYITTWNTEGHHWVDLATTNGLPYTIRFTVPSGMVVVEGGIYSEQ